MSPRYNARGEFILTTYPDDDTDPNNNPQVAQEFNTAGNLVSRTDQRGFETVFAYDTLGRLTAITRPDGDTDPNNDPQETFGYDANGNLVTRTDPLGNTTAYAFNALDRLISRTEPDPDGAGPLAAAVTWYAYDLNGNLVQETDPIGRSSVFVYDGGNQRVAEIRGVTEVDQGGAFPSASTADGSEGVGPGQCRPRIRVPGDDHLRRRGPRHGARLPGPSRGPHEHAVLVQPSGPAVERE